MCYRVDVWAILGDFGSVVRPLLASLRPFFGHFGPSLGHFRPFGGLSTMYDWTGWSRLDTFLGRVLADFWPFWPFLAVFGVQLKCIRPKNLNVFFQQGFSVQKFFPPNNDFYPPLFFERDFFGMEKIT